MSCADADWRVSGKHRQITVTPIKNAFMGLPWVLVFASGVKLSMRSALAVERRERAGCTIDDGCKRAAHCGSRRARSARQESAQLTLFFTRAEAASQVLANGIFWQSGAARPLRKSLSFLVFSGRGGGI